MKKLIFAVAAIVLVMAGCKEDPIEIVMPDYKTEFEKIYTSIGQTETADYTIYAYADEALFVGYNRMYFLVEDKETKQVVSDYALSFTPMMDMGMMMHSTPNELPEKVENDNNVTSYNLVYIMPSSAGSWMLNGKLEMQGVSTDFTLNVNVVEKTDTRMLTFLSDVDSAKLFLILDELKTPQIGSNDIVFGIYERKSMMEFPPVNNYIVEFEPEMPTMNHGSPNNVMPTFTENGLYKGSVNFTMTGYWRINVTLKNAEGTVVKDGISFDVNF